MWDAATLLELRAKCRTLTRSIGMGSVRVSAGQKVRVFFSLGGSSLAYLLALAVPSIHMLTTVDTYIHTLTHFKKNRPSPRPCSPPPWRSPSRTASSPWRKPPPQPTRTALTRKR